MRHQPTWSGRRFHNGDDHLTVFGGIYLCALAVAITMAILIHRKPGDLWRHLPEYVIVIVLACYCSSVGSKVLIYDAWLQMEAGASDGTHFYGFATGATLAAFIYAKYRHLNFAQFLDAAFPAVLAGSSIGRIGCLVAGCCGGSVLGIPTQVVSSVTDGAGCVALLAMRRSRGRIAQWLEVDGRLSTVAVVHYGICRWSLEWFRTEPRVAAGWTLAQWFAVVTIAFAVGMASCRRWRDSA